MAEITFDGKTYSSRNALAEAHGLSGWKVADRLRKGWSMTEALGVVYRDNRGFSGDPISFGGALYRSLAELCREYGENRETVASRLERGWTLPQALKVESPPEEKRQPTVAEREEILRKEAETGLRHCQACRAFLDPGDFYSTGARCRGCCSEDMRRSRYGMTLTEAAGLQGRRACAVCGSETRLHLDHDHATGAVRGILCHGCNTALGLLQEDPARIRSLESYLENPPLK